jgi:CO/xanthine dehydrogenase Mo-binding subunit
LAWKSGKTVKIIYDRAEDMTATTKRHPSWSRHKYAVKKDGTILAMELEFVIDGGAYTTVTPVVLSRGTIHATGVYKCDHIRIKAESVATNTPPHGAFRGFGAPQSIFALERHMDKVARVVGLSPEVIRRKNMIHDGDTMATKQVVRDNVNMDVLMDKAFKEADYHNKLKQFASQDPNARYKKGIGFASFLHGGGFTGSGEVYLASVVGVEATQDNKVRVLAASTEIGQGTRTVFSQIAADTLGLACDDIEISQPDTNKVPNSGPTVASRTVMIVGQLVQSACIGLKETLIQGGFLKEDYTREDFLHALEGYLKEFGKLKSLAKYKAPKGLVWNDETYEGDAYASYAWAVYVAEVTVDTVTYETVVDDFVALQEIGKVMNPTLAEGQIEGGVAQAIGYGIYEKVVWEDGRMINNRMTNYIMPTAADLPPIRVFFEESDNPHGPWGAKGIGELPMDGAAPAILSAVENATGIAVNSIPMLPEDLMLAFDAHQESTHG